MPGFPPPDVADSEQDLRRMARSVRLAHDETTRHKGDRAAFVHALRDVGRLATELLAKHAPEPEADGGSGDPDGGPADA